MTVRDLVVEKLWKPARALLTQGLTPDGLARALVVGGCFGIIPVPAVSTVIVAGIAAVFRLNQAAVQFGNYAVYAGQLLLFVPYIRAGAWLFGDEQLSLNPLKLLEMLQSAPLATLEQFGATLLHAVAAWALFTPPAGVVVYLALRPVLARLMRRFTRPAPDA